MMATLFKNILTNNHRFAPEHPSFRRVFVLNGTLLLYILMSLSFFVLNIAVGCGAAIFVNAISLVASILILIFFHATDKIEVSALLVIALVITEMVFSFYESGYKNYVFMWICLLPPLTIFLLDRKKALIIVSVTLSAMLVYLLFNIRVWSVESSFFNVNAIGNIVGVVVVLTLLMVNFDLSRSDAAAKAMEKNAELENAVHELAESKDRLRLILDSTAEAIFGVDIEGRCTFCNASCLELLGCRSEDDLIGKSIHDKIHGKRRDGTPLPITECNIIRTCMDGTSAHADDEVFWRGDVSFDVEYYSYPQYKNGELIGAVVTFTDNTLRKIQAEQIQYYSSHDSLTGLLNRSYYETILQRTDIKNNLPLSVIMADLNGLKLTNDVFGHAAGDMLLIRAADIIKKACREGDIIARLGGDEFVILLPKTQHDVALQIIRRIQDVMSKEKGNIIRCSMSLGCDTKEKVSQPIDITIKNAENSMYQDKTSNRNKVDADMINAIIMRLYEKFPPEEQHSLNVSELSRSIGEALDMAPNDIMLLRRAALLHDIGMVSIENGESQNQPSILDEESSYASMQHPAIGYRILNLFDSTASIAEVSYSHHERWDGKGYPRGLKGEEIPLMARIIAVADKYDKLRVAVTETDTAKAREVAIAALCEESGTALDPNITDVFVNILKRQAF